MVNVYQDDGIRASMAFMDLDNIQNFLLFIVGGNGGTTKVGLGCNCIKIEEMTQKDDTGGEGIE